MILINYYPVADLINSANYTMVKFRSSCST